MDIMTQNVECLVLGILDWLERVEKFQKLLCLAMEQLDDSNSDEKSELVEILLERYMVGVEPCFDEINVLKNNLFKHLSVGSLKVELSESVPLVTNGSK